MVVTDGSMIVSPNVDGSGGDARVVLWAAGVSKAYRAGVWSRPRDRPVLRGADLDAQEPHDAAGRCDDDDHSCRCTPHRRIARHRRPHPRPKDSSHFGLTGDFGDP